MTDQVERYHRIGRNETTMGEALAAAMSIVEELEGLGVKHPSIDIHHFMDYNVDNDEEVHMFAVAGYGMENDVVLHSCTCPPGTH